MIQHRKYTLKKCKVCGKNLKVRNDYLKIHTGFCQSCRKREDWKNPEYRKKCSESHKGKILSEETKIKLSLANTGRVKSIEECKNISEGRKKEYGYASAKHLFTRYKANAKKRKRIFTLTIDEFIKITSENCYYCGVVPRMVSKPHNRVNGEYVHNGVDRIDNNIGYTSKNCVSSCTHCNYAKHKMSVKEFREWINRIYHYQIDTIGSRQITLK